MDNMESVSMSVSGGIPGYIKKYYKILELEIEMTRTVASWVNNLGVSFAHAFTAMVPSVGSSAVIVLRAVNSCLEI